MIPVFPEFKKLEFSDKKSVEFFISKFVPTSDFNFVGTWSWDVRNQMKISQLNDNYVIRFIDYVSGTPFYTFLGVNKINDTAKEIIELSVKEKLKPEIKLIPSYMVSYFDRNIFKVEEDRDNFDYIYSLEELSSLPGRKFHKKRNLISSFVRNNPEVTVVSIELTDFDVQKEILDLFDLWSNNKREKDSNFSLEEEIIVIKNFFEHANELNLISVGVYLHGKLIAFNINEIVDSEYVISHIAKSNISFPGVHTFLTSKSAAIIIEKSSCKFLNTEQDLGIKNLRDAKMQFLPAKFLEKFVISLLD